MQVDGIEVDEAKAADAVRRCILAIQRTQVFQRRYADFFDHTPADVRRFADDIMEILTGGESAKTHKG